MADPIILTASEIALALSDPFGLWHDHHGDPRLKDPEDEYALFLKEQGLRIERDLLLKRHDEFTDLKGESFDTAAVRTLELLKEEHVVIYSGGLESGPLGLRARPDVIQVRNGRCAVEEYKLAGSPSDTHKIQALVYAYLLRKAYGIESETFVISRINKAFPVLYDELLVESAIRRARGIIASREAPYPTYNCVSRWRRLQNKTAHDLRDVTLTWNVGAAHAERFHRMSVHTLEDLVKVDPNTLATLKGLGKKKIQQVLNSAEAQLSKKVIRVGPYQPLENQPEVELFLDLEGSGELFQEDPAWNCIYLIGVLPRAGRKEEGYRSYLARQPDQEKTILEQLFDFLRRESRGYRLYHWYHYERTQLRKASERHGLLADYESLVQPYLEDLCRAAQSSFVLPTPGYSIKVVAPYFGFRWAQDASEVDAMKSAMIWYRQAVLGGDGRDLEKVLRYNEDDCRAMIFVKEGFEKLASG